MQANKILDRVVVLVKGQRRAHGFAADILQLMQLAASAGGGGWRRVEAGGGGVGIGEHQRYIISGSDWKLGFDKPR
jgi:hypothetical protein